MGGEYYIEGGVDIENTSRPRPGCRVIFVGDGAPMPTRWNFGDHSYLLDWQQREVVVPAINVYPEDAFQFSDGALEWWLKFRRLTDHQIRVLIGKKLYQRFLDEEETQAFKVEEVAKEFHLTADQVFNQARVLSHLNYADSDRVGGMWTVGSPLPAALTKTENLGRYKLSAEGHRWIAAGTPEESTSQSPRVTVNIDVHVAVSNVIKAAQESEVDGATKERFELLMRRLEADLQKPEGQGNMQSVKDVLDVANNAKGLLGPAIQFMAQNWDKIERLGGAMF